MMARFPPCGGSVLAFNILLKSSLLVPMPTWLDYRPFLRACVLQRGALELRFSILCVVTILVQ